MFVDLSRTTPSVNDIVSLRLITGEEMIGRLSDLRSDGSSITLAKAALIQLDVRDGKLVGFNLSPLMITASLDAKYNIKKEHILFGPFHPEKSFVDQYTSATSSIAVPPRNGIIS